MFWIQQFKLAMSQILTTKMISFRLRFAIYGVDLFRTSSLPAWPLSSRRKATPSSDEETDKLKDKYKMKDKYKLKDKMKDK